jgi:hypothetical protein
MDPTQDDKRKSKAATKPRTTWASVLSDALAFVRFAPASDFRLFGTPHPHCSDTGKFDVFAAAIQRAEQPRKPKPKPLPKGFCVAIN